MSNGTDNRIKKMIADRKQRMTPPHDEQTHAQRIEAQIKRMYTQGNSQKAIAEALGLTVYAVRKAINAQ